ncbi:MAG: hypothetical protein IK082_06600 [Oscillospiraceae bacterium]|nr:hypothetical protein [Oscillospiraceae bacterium]
MKNDERGKSALPDEALSAVSGGTGEERRPRGETVTEDPSGNVADVVSQILQPTRPGQKLTYKPLADPQIGGTGANTEGDTT